MRLSLTTLSICLHLPKGAEVSMDVSYLETVEEAQMILERLHSGGLIAHCVPTAGGKDQVAYVANKDCSCFGRSIRADDACLVARMSGSPKQREAFALALVRGELRDLVKGSVIVDQVAQDDESPPIPATTFTPPAKTTPSTAAGVPAGGELAPTDVIPEAGATDPAADSTAASTDVPAGSDVPATSGAPVTASRKPKAS